MDKWAGWVLDLRGMDSTHVLESEHYSNELITCSMACTAIKYVLAGSNALESRIQQFEGV